MKKYVNDQDDVLIVDDFVTIIPEGFIEVSFFEGELESLEKTFAEFSERHGERNFGGKPSKKKKVVK